MSSDALRELAMTKLVQRMEIRLSMPEEYIVK